MRKTLFKISNSLFAFRLKKFRKAKRTESENDPDEPLKQNSPAVDAGIPQHFKDPFFPPGSSVNNPNLYRVP